MQDWKIENSLGYLLGRSGRIIAGKLQKEFQKAGYDYQVPHWILLNMLIREDGINQQEIACSIGRDKTAVTRLVSQLEKKNVLVRVPDRQDRRIKRLHLTNLGKEVYQDLLEIVKKTNNEVQSKIDPKELAVCKKVLNQILITENINDV